ncbi:MoaD/ThiS family protein [Aquipuribacter sp. SD81]|uniref:MoaD/ThiS family protein n=1 Tax=Aquipuribacter sp. SD81 TaxID=3127703 RepID=UPI0030168CB8
MRVLLRVPRALATDLGGAREVGLDVVGYAGAAPTVRDVLDAAAAAHPALGRRLRDEQGGLRRFVNVYLAGEEVRRLRGLDTPVPTGTDVDVVQSVAGG